ncbi:MAG: FAD:protein FMN transferase [Deltaproteobacteria bacterium]|nr:FAD:protein FMN transferase [Deltaproteobacteria bacterium]
MIRPATVLILLLTLRGATLGEPVAEIHYIMGTYFRISADGGKPSATRAAMRRCFRQTRSLEALFSRFDAASELNRINHDTSPELPISRDMAALLTQATRLTLATDGTFDVAAGALTALWRGAEQWPGDEAIRNAKRLVGEEAFRVRGRRLLRRPGVRLDLDGIAKGYAVDLCAEQLRQHGVDSALLNLGESSLYGLGAPRGAKDWEVTLRDLNGDGALGTIRLRDQALSVSAVFGHEHRIGTQRVGHIIDPRNGRPLTTAALAAVVMPSATAAEAWSKAVLIEGELKTFATRNRRAGALLVRPGTFAKTGRISFQRAPVVREITASEEPLR